MVRFLDLADGSRPRRGTVIAALAAAGLLAGCKTVGPDFTPQEPPKAAGYAMAGDVAPASVLLTAETRVAGAWWTALRSPDLDAVMAKALAGNQTVAIADADLQQALAQAGVARGALDPRLDGAVSGGRERINFQTFGFPNIPNPTLNVYNIGGAVSYDLDLFGGARRTLEAERATAESAKWRADAAYLALTGNVAQEAVRIAGLRAELAQIAAIIDDDRRNIDLVHAAEAAGGEPQSASAGGQAQLAADEALAPPVRRALAAARHALALLVGRSPAEWAPPDFSLDAFTLPARSPIGLPSGLVRARPDILAAEAALHADTARIGVASANLYPDVRLTGSLAQGAVAPDKLFTYNSTGWMIGPSLSAPLLNGGALRAERRAAEAQARAALARYRQTVLTAFTQVSDVLTALAHDEDQMAADSQALAAAQSSLDDARNALRLGGGSMLAVVDTQERLDRARLQMVGARGQKLLDIIALYTATAADWRGGAGASNGQDGA